MTDVMKFHIMLMTSHVNQYTLDFIPLVRSADRKCSSFSVTSCPSCVTKLNIRQPRKNAGPLRPTTSTVTSSGCGNLRQHNVLGVQCETGRPTATHHAVQRRSHALEGVEHEALRWRAACRAGELPRNHSGGQRILHRGHNVVHRLDTPILPVVVHRRVVLDCVAAQVHKNRGGVASCGRYRN